MSTHAHIHASHGQDFSKCLTATRTCITHASHMHLSLSPSFSLSPSLMQTNMHLARTHTHRQVFSNHVRQPDRKRREGTADVMHTAASHAPLSMVLPNSHLPKECVCVCVRARACVFDCFSVICCPCMYLARMQVGRHGCMTVHKCVRVCTYVCSHACALLYVCKHRYTHER